jgi:septum formation protein
MIYLASTSPRRKELLSKHKIRFRIVQPSYDEKPIKHLSPSLLVKRHALEKGKSSVSKIRKGIVLSADTIVFRAGQVIGKPKNMLHAVRMLKALQGKWHIVYTGVAIIQISDRKVQRTKVFYEKTKVKLKVLSDAEIKNYFSSINPLDKAGSYAIQSKEPNIVRQFKGPKSNAIGLPVERVIKELKGFK